jgi:hypothetical protein
MPGSVCVGEASSSVAVGAATVDDGDLEERVGGVDTGDFDVVGVVGVVVREVVDAGEADFVDGEALGDDFDGGDSLVDDDFDVGVDDFDVDVVDVADGDDDLVGGDDSVVLGDDAPVDDQPGVIGDFKPAAGSRAIRRIPRATSTACCISSRFSQPPSVARHSTSASDATRAITPSHALRSAWPSPWTLRTPVKPSAAASSSGLRSASTRRLRSASTPQP